MLPDDPGQGARRRSHELLRRVRWPVARRLGIDPWGDERSRLLGPGVEFADVREYQDGDDARLLDWNLTARSGRAYVRQSNPDRGLDVWLIVDASASLRWGTAGCLKSDAASELVAAATLLLTRHGNRVGALVFDTRLRHVFPPSAGRRGRLTLLSRLERESGGGDPGPTDLAGVLASVPRLIRRPSLLIVASDFLVPPGWEPHLKALASRHEVIAARIADPREGEIPSIGVVTFEDPETGAQLEIDTSSARLRERYRSAAAEQRRQLLASLRRAGATPLEITTAEPVVTQLLAFLRRRQAESTRPPRPAPA